MKSKNPKIQTFLMKGIAIVATGIMLMTSISFATTSLDDSYLDSSWIDKLLYGTIGSTAKEIEEFFKTHTTLYITNETQLRALAEYVNNGHNCYGKEIILLNDIEIDSSTEWVPIGKTYESPFKGTFDGKCFSINGLKYLKEGKTQEELIYVGLFGISYGNIKNLIINNFNIDLLWDEEDLKFDEDYNDSVTTIQVATGNIVGNNYGTIENCINNSNIRGGRIVGGLVGSNSGSVINCKNTGDVEGFYEVGGIVGKIPELQNNETYNFENIKNCTNEGDIHVAYMEAGGIVGSVTSRGKIINCKNKGKVFTSKDAPADDVVKVLRTNTEMLHARVGGIVGSLEDSNIKNCINEGEIYGYNYIGGIVGYTPIRNVTNRVNTINSVINKGKISGDNNIGGILGIANNTIISNAANQQIVKGTDKIGGIAGKINNTRITNSANTLNSHQDHNLNITGNDYVGGIVGSIVNSIGTSELQYNINKSAIRANTRVGGIAGYVEGTKTTIENCYNGDSITQDKNDITSYDIIAVRTAGGIVGDATNTTIKNCINVAEICIIESGAGGIAGALGNSTVYNCAVQQGIRVDVANWKHSFTEGYEYSTYNNKDNPVIQNIKYDRIYTPGFIGSIVGFTAQGNNDKIEIKKCFVGTSVIGGAYVGGVVGRVGAGGTVVVNEISRSENFKGVRTYAYAIDGKQYGNYVEFGKEVPENLNEQAGINNIGVMYGYNTNKNSNTKLDTDFTGAPVKYEDYKFAGVNLLADDAENVYYEIENTSYLRRGSSYLNLNIDDKDVLMGCDMESDSIGKTSSDSGTVTATDSNGVEVVFTISGGKLNNNRRYFKAGDTITVEAKFNKYLVSSYGPLTRITKDEAPVLKINNSKTMLADNITFNNYTCTVNYIYSVQAVENFEITSLNLLKPKSTVYAVGNDYDSVHPVLGNFSATVFGINVDTLAPSINANVYVENLLETGKYTAGKDVIIEVTTDERIDGDYNRPEIKVEFSESGKGKYNYSKEKDTVGYAKCIDAKLNIDGTTTWKYIYQIQEGDEGVLNISCEGNLVDFAGNATALSVNRDINTIQADTTSPTVTITAKKVKGELGTDITNSITNADILEYTFDWSEKVNDFTVEDITINGGKVREGATLIQDIEDETKYALEVESNVSKGNIGEIEVIVEAGVCKDDASLENIRTENKITVDKKAPNLINYEITKSSTEINIKAIFDEAIGTVSTSDIEIKFGKNNGNGSVSSATIDENDKSIVNYVYNISGADEGNPTIILKQNTVKDIAGNSNNIAVTFENNIELEKHVIEIEDQEYSFSYKKVGQNEFTAITDFSIPTYLKVGDEIKVVINKNRAYRYIVKADKNGHMKKMLITSGQGTSEELITFSENGNGIDITEANIYFDTIAPTVALTANVEEPSENNIYTKGKEIVIIAKTSEEIQNKDNKPEIKISFSQSGIGKYNYQKDSATQGNAKYIETIENEDKTVTWKYKYVVTEGDEGDIILDYANNLTILDLAGNETGLTGHPSVPTASLKTEDLTDKAISGKETKVTYEFYKGNSKITDFTQNTYYKKGETIKVVVKFSNELYSSYGSSNIGINNDTAPKLKINNKEFTTEGTSSKKEITYTYTVKNDENVKLTNLQLTCNQSVYAKKSDNTYETIPGKITGNNGLDISNANLHIYNNGTEFSNNNIKVDTTLPTVAITAKKVGETSNIANNITNATKLIYTFTWSEEVVGFTVEDITVNNGTKGTLSEATKNENGTYSYTMEIIPNVESGNEGNIQVIIEQNACQDLVGQNNVRTESIIRIDKKAPILISLEAFASSNIELDSDVDTVKQYYKAGDEVTVIATFSENIAESEKTKLALEFSESGNAKGNISDATVDGNKIKVDGNKIKYTYTITDKDNGTLSVKGFTGKVVDSAGNITQVTKRTLDGDTIIADTKKPTLKELKVVSPDPDLDRKYKAETRVEIEAIFDEEIYVLDDDEIKLIDTNIEVEAEDGTKTYTNNAPILQIKFGSGTARQMTVLGYGQKEDGSVDRTKIVYSYTIVGEQEEVKVVDGKEVKTTIPGDNGKLSVYLYEHQEDVKACDIAGNVVTLNKNLTSNTITADTTRPTVENITAVVENPIIGNTGIYYKAGNKVEITLTFNEKVSSAVLQPKIQIGFSEDANVAPTTYEDYSYESDWNVNSETIKYTYVIENGDNGYLWVKVPENQFEDEACNENVAKDAKKISNIYADTTDPYLATNSDGNAQWKISYIKNAYGQVTGIEAVGIFNEKVFSMSKNSLITLNDIPLLGVFVNGQLQDTAENPSVTVESEKTKLTYQIDAKKIDTTGTISANFIDGTVYDRAGNKMSIELTDGDITSPIFQDIKVITPNGFYKAEETIEIVARFKETTKLDTIPTLKARIGDKEIPLTGKYNAEDPENTDTIKVARYTYKIVSGDNGALNIISLTGKASDGVRTSEEISQIYIDLTDNDINDVNAKPETLLNSTERNYANNNEEYENVIADTTKPYITKVETKVNNEVIALYIKEDGKDAITTVGKTNADEIEYVITFSELVKYKDGMQVFNGTIKEITNNDTNNDGYYDQVTVKVQPTVEGVQSLLISDGVFEDRAGNENNAERFNLLTTDYTKPIIRAKVNGGNYVVDTDSKKATLKETIVVNEEISKFEYIWSTSETLPTQAWETIDVSSIKVNSDINLTKEITKEQVSENTTYYLYVRVTDIAGNVLEARTNEFKVNDSKITLTADINDVTNTDVNVTVDYGEALTENRRAGISGKTQSADSTKVIVSENGTVYAEAMDKVGNKVYNTLEITNIDKTAPEATITYKNNEDNTVTAIISFNEQDVTITNNSGKTEYKFTENGEFIFEFKDKAGNKGKALAKVESIVPLDKTAPIITFKYTLTTTTVGNSIGASIITNEEAKISYSWDNKNWITSEEYITSVNAVESPTKEGTYTLYAKATDKSDNTSDVEKLEFTVVKSIENVDEPKIIFEDLPIIQVDEIKYVKVSADMTLEQVTAKMNKTALNGATPKYEKLTEDGKLKTGSEITLNEKIQYIIVVNGDVNCDGKVGPVDVTYANSIRLNKVNASTIQKLAADFDLDGVIKPIDITMINSYRLGKIKGI